MQCLLGVGYFFNKPFAREDDVVYGMHVHVQSRALAISSMSSVANYGTVFGRGRNWFVRAFILVGYKRNIEEIGKNFFAISLRRCLWIATLQRPVKAKELITRQINQVSPEGKRFSPDLRASLSKAANGKCFNAIGHWFTEKPF